MGKFITLSQLITALQKLVAKVEDLVKAGSKEVENLVKTKIDDAPKDGKSYVRKDGKWSEVSETSIEAASDEEVAEAIEKILSKE